MKSLEPHGLARFDTHAHIMDQNLCGQPRRWEAHAYGRMCGHTCVRAEGVRTRVRRCARTHGRRTDVCPATRADVRTHTRSCVWKHADECAMKNKALFFNNAAVFAGGRMCVRLFACARARTPVRTPARLYERPYARPYVRLRSHPYARMYTVCAAAQPRVRAHTYKWARPCPMWCHYALRAN